MPWDSRSFNQRESEQDRCRARNLLSGSELASTAAARSGRSGG